MKARWKEGRLQVLIKTPKGECWLQDNEDSIINEIIKQILSGKLKVPIIGNLTKYHNLLDKLQIHF